jgi:hypothetical protein
VRSVPCDTVVSFAIVRLSASRCLRNDLRRALWKRTMRRAALPRSRAPARAQVRCCAPRSAGYQQQLHSVILASFFAQSCSRPSLPTLCSAHHRKRCVVV